MTLPKNMMNSPKEYADNAILAREAGGEMLNRLEWMTLKPKTILDVGCKTGEVSLALQARYPDANMISIDLSETMLQYAKEKIHLTHCICANAENIPLTANSIDLIFANFYLPWQQQDQRVFHEFRRVLKHDGIMIFSALGPDTLRELRGCQLNVPQLVDMHDLGDLLVTEGFSDPVLDVDLYTLAYRDKTQLLTEFKATGMVSAETTLADLENLLPLDDGSYQVTFEIVYGHAFQPPHQDEYSAEDDGSVRIPIANLRRRLRNPE